MTKETNKDISKEARYELARRRRRSLVRGGKLHIAEEDKDPNYHYRVVNDQVGSTRVQSMQALGYDIVTDDIIMGDGGLADTSKFGSAVSKSVGGGITGILMRIPKELYEEGRALLEEKCVEIDRSLGRGKGLEVSHIEKKIET